MIFVFLGLMMVTMKTTILVLTYKWKGTCLDADGIGIPPVESEETFLAVSKTAPYLTSHIQAICEFHIPQRR